MPGYYETRALRGDYDKRYRAASDQTTSEESLREARVSDLGGYLFLNWSGNELGYMPSCENIYHIARAIIRGGWRKTCLIPEQILGDFKEWVVTQRDSVDGVSDPAWSAYDSVLDKIAEMEASE